MKFETVSNDWHLCLTGRAGKFGLYTNFENRGLCIQLNLVFFGIALWRTRTARYLATLKLNERARYTFPLAMRIK